MAVVGWLGLGRLGGSCAAALQRFGLHKVVGYDPRGTDPASYDFAGLPAVDLVADVDEVVARTDGVAFVAVQTPHAPAYGGDVVAPDRPREFEYAYLVDAVRAVCRAAEAQRKYVALVVVSTVMPGAFNRHLRPLLNEYVVPIYHPFFIAMGTTVEDFVRPELTLLGVDRREDADYVLELYRTLDHGAPAPVTSIESAELAKVAYNTYITSKIVFANALAELCDHTGADVDEVIDVLTLGTKRITSAAYLRAGMGDGGACHPRDNVALSALARRFDLSVDLMGFMIRAREAQTQRLADLVDHWRSLSGLPVTLLGKAYKPEVSLVDGSPALLLARFLDEHGVDYRHIDPRVDRFVDDLVARPEVYVVATAHAEFSHYDYPAGSVVIDPFGYVPSRPGVTLVTPGRKR